MEAESILAIAAIFTALGGVIKVLYDGRNTQANIKELTGKVDKLERENTDLRRRLDEALKENDELREQNRQLATINEEYREKVLTALKRDTQPRAK